MHTSEFIVSIKTTNKVNDLVKRQKHTLTSSVYFRVKTDACNNNDLAVKLNTPPPVTTSKCRVFGDPHIMTFDGGSHTHYMSFLHPRHSLLCFISLMNILVTIL